MVVQPATDPRVEVRNGLAFTVVTVLTYLAAPVMYVGVVQAALCAKLGANATVANLPSTVFILGGVAPLLVSSRIPIRYERATAAGAMVGGAVLVGAMAMILMLPAPNVVKIGFVIAASSLTGVLSLIQQTYVMQCLKRGTSLVGRARTLKIAFTIGPIAAVLGSLLAQYLLHTHAADGNSLVSFAILYFVGVPCLLISAIFTSRMQLSDAPDELKPPFIKYLGQTMRAVARYSPLLLICAIATIHNLGMSVMPNLALYGTERTGRSAEELVGFMLAARFGAKSIAGGLFGFLAERRGTPAALVALEMFLLTAVVVGSFATGYSYLAAFAFIGGAELAGVYQPNYCLSISRTETGARNLSVLMIISSLASIGAAIHGLLSDFVGFRASFLFAGLCAVVALALILRLPAEDAVTEPPNL
jgi:MFS family permease